MPAEEQAREVAGRAIEIIRSEFRTEFHSGPLPRPEVLKAYDQLQPGAADRIIAMAEREQGHRHDLETLVVSEEARLARRGQVAGATVAVSGLLVALGLGVTGNPLAGAIIAAVDLLGVVGLFVVGTRRQEPARPPLGRGEQAPGGGNAQLPPATRAQRRANQRAQRRK